METAPGNRKDLENTTQWGHVIAHYPMKKHHESCFPWDNRRRLMEEVVMDTKNTTESTVSALKQALRKDIKQTLEMTNLEEQQSLFDSQQESATDTIGTLFIALRVRELVGYVHDYNNMFLQPVQMLNVGTSTARKLWNAPHPRPPSMSGNVEWSYGGCPYHENYYGMATPQV